MERNQLLIRIANVLQSYATFEKDDWMLFTAARHLNSVPEKLTNPTEMVTLNLTVGKIANAKGAFNEAVSFLHAAADRLDPISCWENHYELTLDVKSILMETENISGNDQRALDLHEEIVRNARTLADKSRAHIVCVDALSKNGDYARAVDKTTSILKAYGIDLPSTSPTEMQVKREKFLMNMSLGGRSLLCLSRFPMANDEVWVAQIRLCQMLMLLSQYERNFNYATILGFRILRQGLEKKSITKDFPFVLVLLAGPLRREEKYEAAFSFANAALTLMDLFPGGKGPEYIKSKMALYGSLSSLRLPFRDGIKRFLDLNKQLISRGENDLGLGCGMLTMLAFFNASLPLNSFPESNLLYFEELSSNLGKKNMCLIFQMIRQCLYNLKGGPESSRLPADLNGSAFNEDESTKALHGDAARMTMRDLSMIRLKLAVVFDVEAVMDEMLDRLKDFPVYDLPIERQHIRMSYVGFASLILKSRKHMKWAKTCLKFFEKLASFGSPNAPPVYACMKALENPRKTVFDDAIRICGSVGLLNLSALMNERCGLMLAKDKNQNDISGLHVRYLKNALWLYHEWGAMGKVEHLQRRFPFLRTTLREKTPSHISSVRRNSLLEGPRIASWSGAHSC